MSLGSWICLVLGLQSGGLAELHKDSTFVECKRQHAAGDTDAAVAAMLAWCREKPRNPAKWLVTAEFLVNFGKAEDAERFAAKALDVFPEVPRVYVLSSRVSLKADQPEKAIELLENARLEFPESAAIVHALGLAYGLNKQTIVAQEFLDKAVALEPESAAFLFSAGENCWLLGDHHRAEGYFQRAAESKPAHPDARWRWAQVLGVQEKDELAEEQFQQAVASETAPGEAALQYGIFLKERGRDAEALSHFESITAHRPNDRMAWQYQAKCLMALGQRDKAKAALARYRALQRAADEAAGRAALEPVLNRLKDS